MSFWICVCVGRPQILLCSQKLVLNVGIKAFWYTRNFKESAACPYKFGGKEFVCNSFIVH